MLDALLVEDIHITLHKLSWLGYEPCGNEPDICGATSGFGRAMSGFGVEMSDLSNFVTGGFYVWKTSHCRVNEYYAT